MWLPEVQAYHTAKPMFCIQQLFLFVLCSNHDIFEVHELEEYTSINLIPEEVLHGTLVSVLSLSSSVLAIKTHNPVSSWNTIYNLSVDFWLPTGNTHGQGKNHGYLFSLNFEIKTQVLKTSKINSWKLANTWLTLFTSMHPNSCQWQFRPCRFSTDHTSITSKAFYESPMLTAPCTHFGVQKCSVPIVWQVIRNNKCKMLLPSLASFSIRASFSSVLREKLKLC